MNVREAVQSGVTFSGPLFQKIADASKSTGLSQYYLRAGCKDGSIPCVKSGRTYYINIGELLKLLGGGVS